MNKWWILIGLTTVTLMAQEGKPVVAILGFKNTTGRFFLDEVARSFPAQLKTELSQSTSLVVVEREKMDAVMKEQDFVLSDLSEDKDKQAKVGDLLGADFLITGDVSEANQQIRIDISITKTSSGQVIGEKVIGPSKKELPAMAKVLAQNVVVQLTGDGTRVTKLRLKGAPATEFLIATAVLTTASLGAMSKTNKLQDQYRATTDVGEIHKKYKSADRWNKTTRALQVTAGVAFAGWVWAFLKNRSTNRDVIAESGLPTRENWVMEPYTNGSLHGLQLTVKF